MHLNTPYEEISGTFNISIINVIIPATFSSYLIIVYGKPEFCRNSSPIFLYFNTPNRFIMLREKWTLTNLWEKSVYQHILHSFFHFAYLHGNSLHLVTPIDDTRITLFTEEGNTDTRFFTPTQSSNK